MDGVQTAAIWIRGLLEDEYGVSPKETPWYAAGGHHWDDEDDQDEIQPRNGAVINWLETKKNTGVQMVNQALAEGTLDAVGSPLPPASFLRGDGRVRRVIENFYEAERAYYEKTRIFPIMHILALKKSLAEEHPDLPRKLFAFFYSRQAASVARYPGRYEHLEHGMEQPLPRTGTTALRRRSLGLWD